MRSLSADGRAAEALDVYRAHRRLLADELGMDPSRPAAAAGDRDPARRWYRRRAPPPASRAVRPRATARCRGDPAPLLGRAPGPRAAARLPRPATDRHPRRAGRRRQDPARARGRPRTSLRRAPRSGGADLSTVTARTARRLRSRRPSGVEVPRGATRRTALADALRVRRGRAVPGQRRDRARRPGARSPNGSSARLPGLATAGHQPGAAGRRGTSTCTSSHRSPLPVGRATGTNAAVRLFLDRAPGSRGRCRSRDDDVDGHRRSCAAGWTGCPWPSSSALPALRRSGSGEFARRLGAGPRPARGRPPHGRGPAPHPCGRRRLVLRPPDRRRGAACSRGWPSFPRPFDVDQAEARVRRAAAGRARRLPPLLARLVGAVAGPGGAGAVLAARDPARLRRRTARRGPDRHRLRGRHAADTARRLSELNARIWTAPRARGGGRAGGDDARTCMRRGRTRSSSDRPLAVRLAGDIHDFAYYRQRPDLLDWGLTVAGWDIDHPGCPTRSPPPPPRPGPPAGSTRPRSSPPAVWRPPADPVPRPRRGSWISRRTCAMFASRIDEGVRLYRQAGDALPRGRRGRARRGPRPVGLPGHHATAAGPPRPRPGRRSCSSRCGRAATPPRSRSGTSSWARQRRWARTRPRHWPPTPLRSSTPSGPTTDWWPCSPAVPR